MLKEIINGKNIREIIEKAIGEFHHAGPIHPGTLEKLSLIKKYHNDIFTEYEAKLLSVMGLFYKLDEPQSALEAIYKNIGETLKEKYGHQFTPMQASAYKAISEKQFYSFSAPTSTGKSHLFRELIKEYHNDIIIVVPSRALIAEFYSTIIDLVDKDVLVLQFIENINQHNASRRIFIITPERGIEIFKYAETFDIGLFLFDEAQISEDPVRGFSFDAFVRRANKIFPRAKKVFSHPFVANPQAQIAKHKLNKNSKSDNYMQSNVGKIYIALECDGSFSYFSPYSNTDSIPLGYDPIEDTLINGRTVLIYISKTKIFNGGHIEAFGNYIDKCPLIEDDAAIQIIEKLRLYIGSSNTQFGKQSSFLQLMERGIVVHHGSMPLKARLLMEHFVREGHAKLCFATSTLNQGINMPFDCVLIDNYNRMEKLTLKNLIGRSGRSSAQHKFDFGFTIVNRKNVDSFIVRIKQDVTISETSKLDDDLKSIPEDQTDLVEAMKTDSFNDELHLTNSQVDRIIKSNLKSHVRYVLDKLFDGETTITGSQYYNLKDSERRVVKDKIKNIYCSHLKKPTLSKAEQTVLSAAIPLLLWKVQGKSFSETLSLRHAYLTERDMRRDLRRKLREKKITQSEYNSQLKEIKIIYSARAESLPNSQLKSAIPLFPRNESVTKFDYDLLVYDTYDYLDKVISLSLADPLSAALTIYFEETHDARANVFKNYLKYGTNDESEIWLIKYGFDPEDVEWIIKIIAHIDENGIVFRDVLSTLNKEEIKIIERYI